MVHPRVLLELIKSPSTAITALALFLVYWVTVTSDARAARVDMQLIQVVSSLSQHMAETSINSRVLRQICVNGALTESARKECVQ